MRLAQGSSAYPKCGGGLATVATAETIFVDGGGDQRLEAAGGEEDDPETQEAERAMRGRRGFGEISKILPVTIYSLTLSV